MQGIQFERDVARQLPRILADLLDEPDAHVEHVPPAPDTGVDLIVDAAGRAWAVQVKTSSSPGTVAAVADRIETIGSPDAIPLLVVPYMSPGGARAAEARGLSWIDMSGNASLRDEGLFVWVHGRPNAYSTRGRPASAFTPKSSRVARALLLDPQRWWVQKDLADCTTLDRSQVSRAVRRLEDDRLLERDGQRLRPRDPDLLLDAWAEAYRFDRHDIISGHVSGSGPGPQLARELNERLREAETVHAFTGLAAAWALNRFARFRLTSVYVVGDPRAAADAIAMRRNERGANVQLIGPDDDGVFCGQRSVEGLPCVAPVQTYLDLSHMPERAAEAAEQLRADGALWNA